MNWANILTPVLTFAGGAGGAEFIRSWRSRDRQDSENRRDDAIADNSVVAAAVALLEPYRTEVAKLSKDVEALKGEMQADRREQSRVTGLLQQAIAVIRDCIDVLNERNIPAPQMTDELLAEIGRAP